MKKCVSSGSMSCYYPIANCRPMCYDSKCQGAAGCDCEQCKEVGPGKTYDWITWANLENSNSGGVKEKVCSSPTSAPTPAPNSPSGADNLDQVTEAIGGAVAVKTESKGGKCTAYSKAKGVSDDSKVTYEMGALREVDAAGNTVGSKSFSAFANQDFTVGAAQTVKMGVGNAVSAQKTNCRSSVSAMGSTIAVDTYLITSKGNVGPDGEPWAVVAGDVKFNVALSGWNWDGSSDGVELDVKLQGKATTAVATPGKANRFSMGGTIELQLTDKIMVDGKQTTMKTGYPKLKTVGGFQVVTVHFPKFTTSALYDPLLTTGTVGGQGVVASHAMGSTVSLYPLLVAAILTRVCGFV